MNAAFVLPFCPTHPVPLKHTSTTFHPPRPCPNLPPTPKAVFHPPPTIKIRNSPTDPLTKTLLQIRASPIVLCIRMTDATQALLAAQAAIRGGLHTIEVTLTTPDAPQIIRSLSTAFPHACIGVGTVLTPHDVTLAQECGARFALSPVTDERIIRQAHDLGLLAVPGAATPTEMHNAYHKAGARLVKIFPVNLYGGIDFVKAMQGPLGHIPLLPTSGIDAESLPEYLAARNVWAVGASRQILLKDALERSDWDRITQGASEWAAIAAKNTPHMAG